MPSESEWLDADIATGDAAGPWSDDPAVGVRKMEARLALLNERPLSSEALQAVAQVRERLRQYRHLLDSRN